MEIVVKGHHSEVSDRFRGHVEEKLARLEKFDQRIIRVDVEVSQEPNPRLSAEAVRIEITIKSKGPVVRAEACAEDKLSALDKAVERLSTQVRKAHDRRRVHHGSRTPTSVGQAMAAAHVADEANGRTESVSLDGESASLSKMGEGSLVVREKSHPGTPISLDQALYEMELVGHDFFLFIDEADKQPAVVYRRKGYDYGVIRLER